MRWIVGCLLLQLHHRLAWTSSETYSVDSLSIAVCVGGQTARFIPEALRPLISDNEKVRFSGLDELFSRVLVLQPAAQGR